MREKILFFDEVILYEDELDDNGCAVLSAKIVSVRELKPTTRHTMQLLYSIKYYNSR